MMLAHYSQSYRGTTLCTSCSHDLWKANANLHVSGEEFPDSQCDNYFSMTIRLIICTLWLWQSSGFPISATNTYKMRSRKTGHGHVIHLHVDLSPFTASSGKTFQIYLQHQKMILGQDQKKLHEQAFEIFWWLAILVGFPLYVLRLSGCGCIVWDRATWPWHNPKSYLKICYVSMFFFRF